MNASETAVPRPRLGKAAMRGTVVFHRWAGIVMCLFIAMWFASGAVMMYVPYPFLGDGARVARGAPIEGGQVIVAPAAAVAASGIASPARVRLLQVNGQATYVLNPAKGPQMMVSASTGRVLPGLSQDAAGSIAGAFAQIPPAAVSEPMDYDQWMVHHRFDRYRPFYKVSFGDEAGTQLYVSQRSGEVMQRTTRFERAWNYAGAVVHWIYPTVLRQSWMVWDRTVWWFSLLGVAVTIAGIWLGVARWRGVARLKRGRLSPYHGWLQWHHVGGLAVAGFVFTWMLSGWLSMDHGRFFSTGEMSDAQASAYTGLTTAAAAGAVTPGMVQRLLPASEIEVVALAGEPYLVARGAGGGTKVAGASIPLSPAPLFSADAVWRAVSAAYPGRTVLRPVPIPPDDVYANLRSADGIGGDGLRVVVRDDANSAVYVNPVTGRVIEVMDTSRRAYRWLYFGLHTLDFPFLSNNAVWRPLMLVLLAGGFAFSVTGVAIGWKRLVRKAARARARTADRRRVA